MRTRALIPVLAAACLLLAGGTLAAGTHAVDWSVLGGGGGRVEEAQYTLDYSVGQAVTGTASQASTYVCAGYWCAGRSGAGVKYPTYVPLVLRGGP